MKITAIWWRFLFTDPLVADNRIKQKWSSSFLECSKEPINVRIIHYISTNCLWSNMEITCRILYTNNKYLVTLNRQLGMYYHYFKRELIDERWIILDKLKVAILARQLIRNANCGIISSLKWFLMPVALSLTTYGESREKAHWIM